MILAMGRQHKGMCKCVFVCLSGSVSVFVSVSVSVFVSVSVCTCLHVYIYIALTVRHSARVCIHIFVCDYVGRCKKFPPRGARQYVHVLLVCTLVH